MSDDKDAYHHIITKWINVHCKIDTSQWPCFIATPNLQHVFPVFNFPPAFAPSGKTPVDQIDFDLESRSNTKNNSALFPPIPSAISSKIETHGLETALCFAQTGHSIVSAALHRFYHISALEVYIALEWAASKAVFV